MRPNSKHAGFSEQDALDDELFAFLGGIDGTTFEDDEELEEEELGSADETDIGEE